MYNSFRNPFWPSLMTGSFFLFLIPLIILELFLKGYALWKAARNGQSGWFCFLLVLNTLGILPIVYLAFFQTKTEVTVLEAQTKAVKTSTAKKKK